MYKSVMALYTVRSMKLVNFRILLRRSQRCLPQVVYGGRYNGPRRDKYERSAQEISKVYIFHSTYCVIRHERFVHQILVIPQ